MKNNQSVVPIAVAVAIALLSALTVAHAATTIGTDIQTDGMLSVTGTTTLTGIIQDENPDYEDGTPTSVFISDGTNSLCEEAIQYGTFYSVVIGGGATLSPCAPDRSVLIGQGAQAGGQGNNYYQVIIGYDAQVTGNNPKDVVIGAQSQAINNDNTVVGFLTKGVSGSTVMGSQATSNATDSTAIGRYAYVASGATDSVAIASGISGANSIAVNGQVTGTNSASWGDASDTIAENYAYVYGTPSISNGFGTPTPQNRLDVLGASAIGTYAGVNTAPPDGLVVSGAVGFGTSTPSGNFQVANGNATTTMQIGSAGQSKGSCLKLYRTDGSAIYAYVATGATTFTLTTTACASVSNF